MEEGLSRAIINLGLSGSTEEVYNLKLRVSEASICAET
jgi:hypothetical protein